jgi:DNA-binding IclR family transcriptional regulator
MIASHRKVLEALNEEGCDELSWNYLTFAMISSRTQMDRKEVRRIARHLARKGWTEYGRGLWTEDGEIFGSGYRITEAGALALSPADGNGIEKTEGGA